MEKAGGVTPGPLFIAVSPNECKEVKAWLP